MVQVATLSVQQTLAEAVRKHEAGDLVTARSLYRALLSKNPVLFEALHLLGVLEHQQGQSEAGLALIERALALRPADPTALSNAGLVLRALKRPLEALSAYEGAVQGAPNFHQAWANRGNVLRDLGRAAEALQSYVRAIECNATYAQAWHGKGLAHFDLQQFEDAQRCHRHALVLQPGVATVEVDLGNALRELDRLTEAVASYERALALRPNYPQALSNRGVVLKQLGQFAQAQQSYERAIALDPLFVDAYVNLGTLLKDTQRLSEAKVAYQKALELDPESSSAHLNLSIALLLGGEFSAGFGEYEWRWKTAQMADGTRGFAQPLWRPALGIRGKTLLLHAEQGLGDTIQFCRYAPIAAAQGARVVLEVQPVLLSLLQGLPGVDQLVARGADLPPFDVQCPLLSAPLAAQTTLETVPAQKAYLSAKPAWVQKWAERLGAAKSTRIGVAWSGRPEHKNDMHRSLSFSEFAGALPKGPEYLCLQKEIRAADRDALASRGDVQIFDTALESFEDTAALIQQVDLVVAVDTSVAHLAAALGKPVWLLLPYCPDWRWMLGRTDTPWYPGVQLFRQSAYASWGATLIEVAQRVEQWVESSKAPH